MKEKIKNYVDDIFSDAPDTDNTRDIKEEMYQNLVERYEDLLAEGKSESAAYNATISGVGDVSELVESLKRESGESTGTVHPHHIYTAEQTERLETQKSKFAVLSAISIALYIVCAVPVILFDAIMGNDFGEAIGVICMFGIIALATGIRIYIAKCKPVELKNYEKSGKAYNETATATEGGRKRNKEKDPVKSLISGILWPVTVALYLLVSFITGLWGITWIMFLIAAAIGNVADAIVDLVRANNFEIYATSRPKNESDGRINKSGYIVRLVIWSVVLACLLSVFFGGVANRRGSFVSFGTIYEYDDVESYNAGNAEYTEDISNVSIFWLDGDVNVEYCDDDKITVTDNYSGGDDFYRMRSKVENGKLIIYYSKPGMKVGFRSRSKDLTVRLPRSIVSIDKFDIVTVSGDLRLNTDVNIDRLKIETVSGKISYTGQGTLRRVDIKGVSGDISLEGDIRNLDIDTVSGKIDLYHTGERMPDSISISGISGAVSFNFPEAALGADGISLELEGISGEIDYLGEPSLPVSVRKSRYLVIGSPEHTYSVSGISSGVTVRTH